jgi:hypothetical protein
MLLKVALNTMKPYQSLFHSFTDLASFHSSRSHSELWKFGNKITGENHDLPQVTEKYNVVHLALIEIRSHNISGDRH